MASIYKIDNTSGTMNITIHPGRANGPGQKNQDSDLFLFGMGSLQWGQGVDRNILRLLENFSCPQKEGTDVQPPGSPGKIWPKGPEDDPIANRYDPTNGYAGISTPLTGQVWFNTTTTKAYVFNQDADGGDGTWSALGGTTASIDPPPQSSTGDLWFNIGDSICHQNQLMIYDPEHCENEGSGWVSASQNYIPRCGTTSFCGELVFNDADCPTNPDGTDCFDPGKIVGAILEDCIIVTTTPIDPAGAPASKRDVHKYTFPEGTRMLFAQPCAPVGWMMDTNIALHGRYLQVTSIPGSSSIGVGGDIGGNASHNIYHMAGTHVPGHAHSAQAVAAGAHTHTGATYNAGNHYHYAVSNYAGNHAHTVWTGAAGNHQHYTQGHFTPLSTGTYAAYLGCRAEHGHYTNHAGNHTHAAAMHNAGNHRHAYNTYYNGTHSHSVSVYSGGNHNHTVTVNATTTPPWEPKYYNSIIAVKQDDEGVFEGNVKGTEGFVDHTQPHPYCSG